MLGVGLPGLWDQFATGGDHRWLLISTEALGVGQRGRDSDSQGRAASGTQPGHVSAPGQQGPSPELGCAGVGSPGRQPRIQAEPCSGGSVPTGAGRVLAGPGRGRRTPHSSPGCSPTVHLAFTSRKGVMSS